MTPPRPGPAATYLAILLAGEAVNEPTHAAHACGTPPQEAICAVEPASWPHILESLAPVIPQPDPFPPRVTHRPVRTVDARATLHVPVTVRQPVG
jgi:hypothetical protein